MAAARHILVTRLSAMGDVAMTVPVIKAVLAQNPDLQITFASRPDFAAFFSGIPRLFFFAIDLKETYKGLPGILKLYNALNKQGRYDAVADLHDILRTKVLRKLFRLSGIPVKTVNKGRAEKKLLTRFPNKVLIPLKRTTERYADVFRSIGCNVVLDDKLVKAIEPLTTDIIAVTGEKDLPWIGITPFAQHKGKIYPLDRMEQVIDMLAKQDVKVFLFGGTALDKEICANWELKYDNVVSIIGRLNMQQELSLINQLDVMLSMDSAGMHLASLRGTPVVSVWGATHHYAGFLGYGQSEANIVADGIECRPCSVYGNKACFRGDYACMYSIAPATIAGQVLEVARHDKN